MNLRLRIADQQQTERLRYAAQLLLDFAGINTPVQMSRAASPQTTGLLLDEDILVSTSELEAVFATATLQREADTGRRDKSNVFDENALAWDVATPWIDIRASQLAEQLTGSRCATAAPREPFRVIITHDLDHTTFREPASLMNAFLHTLGLRRDWVGLGTALGTKIYPSLCERMLEIERDHGIGAYYFMLSGPYGWRRHSSRYDIRWASSRTVLQLITQAGMTVGLHGSYYAREHDTYRIEKERLEQVLGTAVTTHRNHYLRFDPIRVWSQLEAAGIRHDFSVGFNYTLGFRAGCARAYRGFDLHRGTPGSVTAVPLLFMDGILFDGDRRDILRRLRLALTEAQRYGGCVSLLFHPGLFAMDVRLWDVLQAILAMCHELGADLSGRLPTAPAVTEANLPP
jgi:hypothetical protein